MPIVARDLDVSERRFTVEAAYAAAGASFQVIGPIAGPAQIDAVRVAALGLSSSPTIQLQTRRFIVGTGETLINIGGALTVVAHGTSGIQGYSLPAAGSTLLQLAENDILGFTIASGGVGTLTISTVIRSLQDIKSFFSVAP